MPGVILPHLMGLWELISQVMKDCWCLGPWVLSNMIFTTSDWVYSSGTMHYNDVIISAIAPQIIGVSIVCSTICSGAADQRKYQSFVSLAFVKNPPVTSGFPSQRASNAEMFPFGDVIMGQVNSHSATIFPNCGAILNNVIGLAKYSG